MQKTETEADIEEFIENLDDGEYYPDSEFSDNDDNDKDNYQVKKIVFCFIKIYKIGLLLHENLVFFLSAMPEMPCIGCIEVIINTKIPVIKCLTTK